MLQWLNSFPAHAEDIYISNNNQSYIEIEANLLHAPA